MDFKWPKIWHFSFSENLQNDDRMLSSDDIFINKDIVVGLKLDGEGTGMSQSRCHARSLDSRDHPSRHWVKGLWGQIKHLIDPNMTIFGENVFAKHSIFYPELTTYFYVFAIFDGTTCLSWNDTKDCATILGLQTVPELYVGVGDLNKIKDCYDSKLYFGAQMEGYVARNAASFSLEDFQNNYGKFVRANHVQTSQFWLNEPIVPNKIKL